MSTRFVLTGFGKFQGVESNPTTHLIEDLKMLKGVPMAGGTQIIDAQVIETSVVDVACALSEILCSVVPDDLSRGRVVLLHLGVHAAAEKVKLETEAANKLDFGCPDERGFAPRAQPIWRDGPPALQCKIDLPRVLEMLSHKEQVALSPDPGMFICGYTAFSSMRMAQHYDNLYSLFVHVPLFETIDRGTQKAIVLDIIFAIHKSFQ